MRKYIGWMLLVTLCLVSCKPNEKDTVTFKREVSVIFDTVNFEASSTKMGIYGEGIEKGSDYVDVVEFLEVLSPVLIDFQYEIDEKLVITYIINQESIRTQFTISLDSINNEVIFSDFGKLYLLNRMNQTEVTNNFETIDVVERNMESKPVIIDLDYYDFEILEDDGVYYMPIFLANLFFSGEQIEVYNAQNSIYVIDDPAYFDSSNLSDEVPDEIEESQLIYDSKAYLALLYDFFYGTKLEIYPDAKTLFTESGMFDETLSIEDFNKMTYSTISSLQDLHSSIYSFGYGRSKSNIVNYYFPSQYYKEFITAYNSNRCGVKAYEGSLTETQEYYVLRIDSFSEKTSEILKGIMVDIDESKDFFIDLTCNQGGLVTGMLELVTYLTNDSFTVNYTNPITKEFTAEHLQSTQNNAIKNNVYVHISGASFSAANIFAEIVKENGLGYVVGERTRGGAAAVSMTILPSNTILYYSSNIVFTSKDGEDIDRGVAPDYDTKYEDPLSIMMSLDEHVKNLIRQDIKYQDEVGTIAFDYSSLHETSLIQIDEIQVDLIDVREGSLISSDIFESTIFRYEYDISAYDTVVLRIRAKLEINGVKMERTLEFKNYDILPDSIIENMQPIALDTEISGYKHSENDKDFVAIDLVEDSLIKILVNKGFIGFVKIYDESGVFITNKNEVHLKAGRYYIDLNINEVAIGDYQYEVQVIETLGMDIYDLIGDEGSYTLEISYDYPNDIDHVNLEIGVKSLVTITVLSSNDKGSYSIFHDDIKLFDNYGASSFKEPRTYIIEKGEYTINVIPYTNVTMNIVVEEYNETSEVNGSYNFSENDYPIFTTDIVSLSKDSQYDEDVYVITLDEDIDLIFDINPNYSLRAYHKETEKLIIGVRNYITLKKGTNYIIISMYGSESETDAFFLIPNDTNTIENMEVITLGEPFEAELSGQGDVDYFKFVIDQTQTLEVSIRGLGDNDASYAIYDNTRKRYVVNKYEMSSHNYVTLSSGDYILELCSNNPTFNTVKISTSDIEDDYINLPLLNDDEYVEVILSTTNETIITGRIDYSFDVDVILLTVDEEGYYVIQTYYNVFLISKNDGSRLKLRNSDVFFIANGEYYLEVNGFSVKDWVIELRKEEKK